MTTFLNAILDTKKREVEAMYRAQSKVTNNHGIRAPEPSMSNSPKQSFARSIRQSKGLAVIAEIKQASPSKGIITTTFRPVEQAHVYAKHGATAISVLTDESYFHGSIDDLVRVRQTVPVPLLRKDFIIDEIQIYQAASAGANAILLICAALEPSRLIELKRCAGELGLDTLVEVHTPDETEFAVTLNPSVIGINNRNLHTFEVTLETTKRIMPYIPANHTVISESGIRSSEDAHFVAQCGVEGILVGDSLMRLPTKESVANALRELRVSRHPRTESGQVQ